jgi:nicotinamidase-related amidase
VNESLIPGKQIDLRQHNLEGTVQTELMPQLYEEGDYLIDNKKRMSAFYGTDLEILLRTLKRNTLALIGINTNTCVLSTAFDAYNRDFKVVLIADAVGSAFGEELHQFALENVRRCMGWVLTLGEFEEKIGTLRQEGNHDPD